jgi:hypothetical protein
VLPDHPARVAGYAQGVDTFRPETDGGDLAIAETFTSHRSHLIGVATG